LFAVIELLKPRVKRLDDFVVHGRFFFTDAIEYDQAAVDKHLRIEGMREHLAALDAAFAGLEHFDQASVEAALRATAESRGVKAAVLIHAIRVTVTGKAVSPGLFEVLALLGPDEVHRRLTEMVELLGVPRS
jgi:glutamyl-tRNA synthetase